MCTKYYEYRQCLICGSLIFARWELDTCDELEKLLAEWDAQSTWSSQRPKCPRRMAVKRRIISRVQNCGKCPER